MDVDCSKDHLMSQLIDMGFEVPQIFEILPFVDSIESALERLMNPPPSDSFMDLLSSSPLKVPEIPEIPEISPSLMYAEPESEASSETPLLQLQIYQTAIEFGVDPMMAEYLSTTCESMEEFIEAIQGGGPQQNTQNAPKPPPKIKNPYPKVLKLKSSGMNPRSYLEAAPVLNAPKMHHTNYDHFYPRMKNPRSTLRLNFEEDVKTEAIEEIKEPPRNNSGNDLTNKPDNSNHYFKVLSESRLVMCDRFSDFSLGADSQMPLPRTLQRINKEIRSLAKSLPCEASGSIFIAVNSENISQMKAIISGSADTPYSHGLYLFEILLPSDYPNKPPLVKLRTTGGGRIRFNPNLYMDGKVCLSVINTWSGGQDERWNPAFSTILQVLVSIQALVMDNNVIQKEPSFERLPYDSPENISYNWIVKYGNMLFAMADMIRNPPNEFKEVIRNHFTFKSPEIKKSIDCWAKEAGRMQNLNDFCHQNQYISHEIMSKGIGLAFKEAETQVNQALAQLKH